MNNEDEFFCGAFWAITEVWRSHSDLVIVKDLLKELPDAHATAKLSAEYDVLPLRLNVMPSLPLGRDANYSKISYGPVSFHGELICDHSEVTESVADKDYSYGVYGVESDGNCVVLLNDMEPEEAEESAKMLTEQLEVIKSRETI